MTKVATAVDFSSSFILALSSSLSQVFCEGAGRSEASAIPLVEDMVLGEGARTYTITKDLSGGFQRLPVTSAGSRRRREVAVQGDQNL